VRYYTHVDTALLRRSSPDDCSWALVDADRWAGDHNRKLRQGWNEVSRITRLAGQRKSWYCSSTPTPKLHEGGIAVHRPACRHRAGRTAGRHGFGTTDTIVASRYSNDAVAALSVGSAIFISVYASLMGIFQALLPLWSEQRGAGQPQAIGHSLRQSMYLCALACVLGMAVLLMPDALLRWTDVPDALQLEVKRYLAVLAWGLPPALLFRIYSALNQALGHPKLVTGLQLVSLLIKIPLSIWFTFGGLGLAPWEQWAAHWPRCWSTTPCLPWPCG
jgi:hypothetical protein